MTGVSYVCGSCRFNYLNNPYCEKCHNGDKFVSIYGDKVEYSKFYQHCASSMSIKKVIFNPPATIVLWNDGTKTVVKCGENDIFDPEKGMAMAIAKKALGNRGNYYEIFKKWVPEYTITTETPKTTSESTKTTESKDSYIDCMYDFLLEKAKGKTELHRYTLFCWFGSDGIDLLVENGILEPLDNDGVGGVVYKIHKRK